MEVLRQQVDGEKISRSRLMSGTGSEEMSMFLCGTKKEVMSIVLLTAGYVQAVQRQPRLISVMIMWADWEGISVHGHIK